jgi:class 3 adenylate cyclase
VEPIARVRRLAAILAIDMAGYSRRADEDEAAAVGAVGALHKRVHDAARRHSGRVFNTAGDGLMVEFPSANDALAAAADLLESAPEAAPPVRAGVHIGDVYVTDTGDLLGHGVNVAARLQTEAAENCALVSEAVHGLIHGPLQARLMPIGRLELRGMGERIGAFAFDPLRPARPAWRKRRRRSQTIVALAGGAAVISILGFAWSLAQQPSREAMLRQLQAEMTANLVSSSQVSEESIDGAHAAIVQLSRSNQRAEQQAFSFLREGETENAVDALEAYGRDLERAGQREEASGAFGRAGALAFVHDKAAALADFRRARQLAPSSMERFADLLQAEANAEGYPQAFAFADQALRSQPPPSPAIRAYALLYASLMAGDIGDLPLQQRKVAEAAPLLRQLNDSYLNALSEIARGYLAMSELDLASARRLYVQGRADLSRIPGHERDHQHGWLLALLAMGDLETALSAGRSFIEAREQEGAPPSANLMLNTCAAAVQLRQTALAEPYCRAGAQALEGSTGEASGEIALAMLDAEIGDLVAAHAHLEAGRNSRSFAAIPANAIYAGRVEAQIAAMGGDFAAMDSAIDRTIQRLRTTQPLAQRADIFIPWLEIGRGQWAIELGHADAGCAALARAVQIYSRIGAAPGAAHAAALSAAAHCGARRA